MNAYGYRKSLVSRQLELTGDYVCSGQSRTPDQEDRTDFWKRTICVGGFDVDEYMEAQTKDEVMMGRRG